MVQTLGSNLRPERMARGPTQERLNAEGETGFQPVAQTKAQAGSLCCSPAYVYPHKYEGSNHLLPRGGEDNKFRAMLFRDSYRAGEKFEFKLRVAPFAVGVDDWKNAATKLASDFRF